MAPRERIVLLFCHGTSFHKQSWGPIIRRLKNSALLQRVACEFVAIDWRYHGAKRSDAEVATLFHENGDAASPRVDHPARHWLEWAPQDLLRLTKLLRNEDAATDRTTRIVGIGHSIGASTLLNVEINHPGTFAGLVLFEPTFFIGDETFPGANWGMSMMTQRALAGVEKWNSWDDVLRHFQTGKAYQRWHPESLAAFLDGGVVPTGDGTFRLALPLMQEAAFYYFRAKTYNKAQLAGVRCRIVFEFGEHTQLFNVFGARLAVEAVPERFVIAEPLKKTTHLTVAENPDACAAHIVADLEKLPVFERAVASSKL